MWAASTIRFLLAGCLCLSAALSARGPAERILDYHSDITVEDDGTLQVTETITVNSTSNQIRHGIFRDFPTTYTDPNGNRYVVDDGAAAVDFRKTLAVKGLAWRGLRARACTGVDTIGYSHSRADLRSIDA